MLTKKLKFDEQVLDVLKHKTTWSEDGLSCKIESLPRDVYEKTAKALKAMGGKWKGGKTQATVFTTDPREKVEGLLSNGHVTVERDGFVETPKPLAERMVRLAGIQEDMDILEPSAGMAALARVIEAKAIYHQLHVVEKNPDRANFLKQQGFMVVGSDFLKYDPAIRYDRIIANYPFEELQDVDHLMHSYDLLKPGGQIVAIMGESGFIQSKTKKAIALRKWLKEHKAIVEKLPLGKKNFKVNARLVIVGKPLPGTATSLKDIASGDPDKATTHAASRVLAKRQARKAGNPVKVHGKDPVPVKFGRSKKSVVFIKYTRPDGTPVLGGEGQLPDPRTDNLDPAYRKVRDGKQDVVSVMNEQAQMYANTMLSFFVHNSKNHNGYAGINERVRMDFCQYGAQAKDILFAAPPEALRDWSKWKPYSRKPVKAKAKAKAKGRK